MTVRHSSKKRNEPETPETTVADLFKAKLGWRPSWQPFRTIANRQCGGCKDIKLGSEFNVPITPGQPDLNTCRECS